MMRCTGPANNRIWYAMTAYKKTLYSSDILLSYVFLQQQQQHSLLSILQQRSHDNGGVSGVYLWVTANSVTCGWLISGVGPTKQKIIRILNTKFLVGKQNTTQVLFNCRGRKPYPGIWAASLPSAAFRRPLLFSIGHLRSHLPVLKEFFKS